MTIITQTKCLLIFALTASLEVSLSAGSLIDGKNVMTVPEKVFSAQGSSDSGNSRYGFFNLLDHRSNYGEGVFPEPFLVDGTDLERNELRFDWLHTYGPGLGNTLNELHPEWEHGFGQTTLEIELHQVRNVSEESVMQGLDNLDISLRTPLYELVSADRCVNATFGAALEVGVPFFNAVSVNPEIVPKVFCDLSLGKHFTLQSIFGWSTLMGRGLQGGNLQTAEFGFVAGYTLHRKDLPLPGVLQLIPMLEVVGEKTLNGSESGANALSADAGFRVNLKSWGPLSPHLGVTWVFPIDSGGRQQQSGGFMLSAVFEY